jgi:hypothetical protein
LASQANLTWRREIARPDWPEQTVGRLVQAGVASGKARPHLNHFVVRSSRISIVTADRSWNSATAFALTEKVTFMGMVLLEVLTFGVVFDLANLEALESRYALLAGFIQTNLVSLMR